MRTPQAGEKECHPPAESKNAEPMPPNASSRCTKLELEAGGARLRVTLSTGYLRGDRRSYALVT